MYAKFIQFFFFFKVGLWHDFFYVKGGYTHHRNLYEKTIKIIRNHKITRKFFFGVPLTLSQTTILDPFSLKEFADDNFEFDETGRKFA